MTTTVPSQSSHSPHLEFPFFWNVCAGKYAVFACPERLHNHSLHRSPLCCEAKFQPIRTSWKEADPLRYFHLQSCHRSRVRMDFARELQRESLHRGAPTFLDNSSSLVRARPETAPGPISRSTP